MSVSIVGSDKVICNKLREANSLIDRLRGLLFSPQLAADEAILISHCSQVHTHFMKYPIDVVFLNRKYKVKYVVRNLKPWNISRYVLGAHYALELNSNGANQIKIGDILQIA